MGGDLLRKQHRDTFFRGLFSIYKHFKYLLEECRGEKVTLTEDEIEPFALDSEFTIRLRRNDVAYITKCGKLIILIEHQYTENPNMAFRLYMYYCELIQLWLKMNEVNIFGSEKVENIPTPEFYVVYNGHKKLNEPFSTFKIDCDCMKVDVEVKVIDIHYDNLTDKSTENSLAGYSYFYKIFDESISSGQIDEEAFNTARQKCIEADYLIGFVDKEEFILEYKKHIFDYDTQIRAEAREEGEARGKAIGEARGKVALAKEAIILAIESGMSRAFIDALAKKADLSKEQVEELYKSATQLQKAS
jgi:hypothetical protein